MKRFLLLAAIVLCGLASVSADDNVRAAQARLKDGGFYFGAENGNYDSETAAAVSRYQIRNGLQITGQLDAATSKALGVRARGARAAAAPSDSDSWRRLRKTDQQFLSRMNAGAKPSPARNRKATRVTTQTTPAAAASPPAPDGGYQTFTLSRERLRDYVGSFVLAGLDPHVGAELEFFADRVKYYNDGIVDREKIRRDLRKYSERWPHRRFWLAGNVQVEPQPDSRLRVTFPLRFDLRNTAKHTSGQVLKTLLLEVTGADDLQIVAVNERKMR